MLDLKYKVSNDTKEVELEYNLFLPSAKTIVNYF